MRSGDRPPRAPCRRRTARLDRVRRRALQLPPERPSIRGWGRSFGAGAGAGDREPSFGRLRSLRQRDLAWQRGLGLVGAQYVDEVDDVGGRLDVDQVELTDLLNVIEHLG